MASVRQRRRDQDNRLKKQAVSGKRKIRERSKPQAPLNVADALAALGADKESPDPESTAQDVHPQRRLKMLYPELLPEHILAAEPDRPIMAHLLGPNTQGLASKKHIVFRAEERPPREIKRGPVRVKVLEASNPSLPPPASKVSRHTREQWLQGRVGRKGKPAVERRKVGGGFLRKP